MGGQGGGGRTPYPEKTKEQVDRSISTYSLCDLSVFDFPL